MYCPNSRTRERLEGILALIARGAMRVRQLITDDVPLDRAPQAYERLLEPGADFLGVVIHWR